MGNDTYTIAGAARELQVSRKMVYALIRRGLLACDRDPLYAPRAPRRIYRAHLDALKSLRTGLTDAAPDSARAG